MIEKERVQYSDERKRWTHARTLTWQMKSSAVEHKRMKTKVK